ncbi:MAG: DUF1893 domain-containing protein [Candidatus Woesearchaeota archaeon]
MPTLILTHNNQTIFSSNLQGLRSLYQLTQKYTDKLQNAQLYDKVVGLAAAKLIVYSQAISEVTTEVCSQPALDFLKIHNIGIKTKLVVQNILTLDKKAICPMELKAMEIVSPADFYKATKHHFLDSKT